MRENYEVLWQGQYTELYYNSSNVPVEHFCSWHAISAKVKVSCNFRVNKLKKKFSKIEIVPNQWWLGTVIAFKAG
jgi:hypothetical protein